MIDYLLDLNFLNISLLYWLLGGWIIWLLVEQRRMIRFDGPLKRGVPVWEEQMEPEVERFLRRLSGDIVVEHGFIRVNGATRLLRKPNLYWWNSWPYVGYVDFNQERPSLQFRASLPALIALGLPILSVFAIPLVAAFFIVNHRVERRAMHDFIDELLAAQKGQR